MPVPDVNDIPKQIGPFECLPRTPFFTLARKAQGRSDKETANELGCTKKMPARHIARAIEKLVDYGHLPRGSRTDDIVELYRRIYGPGLWGKSTASGGDHLPPEADSVYQSRSVSSMMVVEEENLPLRT